MLREDNPEGEGAGGPGAERKRHFRGQALWKGSGVGTFTPSPTLCERYYPQPVLWEVQAWRPDPLSFSGSSENANVAPCSTKEEFQDGDTQLHTLPASERGPQ